MMLASGIPMLALHAPDGLFSLPVCLLFAVVVLATLGASAAALARRHDHRLVPLMGMMAAFVFAAQMVNFPVSIGTTGHLLGGTLAAILLGPAAGTLVMAVVIFFQALLGDGGLTALGPNIFNMGVVGTCLGYAVFRAVGGRRNDQPARVVAAACFAAWTAVVAASLVVSFQLAASGTVPWGRAVGALVTTHALIGIGEGLITAGVVAFVRRTRPDLLANAVVTKSAPLRPVVVTGVAAAFGLAGLLSLLPVRFWDHPDGLERVGQDEGFLLESPQYSPDGRLAVLPAYPLNARLTRAGGAVVVAHLYRPGTEGLHPGDVLERVAGQPVTGLDAVADALGFSPERSTWNVPVGVPLELTVRRNGRSVTLAVNAAAAPHVGAEEPRLALLPEYTFPGVEGLLSTSLAGLVGTAAMFLFALCVGRVLVRPGKLARAYGELDKQEG